MPLVSISKNAIGGRNVAGWVVVRFLTGDLSDADAIGLQYRSLP